MSDLKELLDLSAARHKHLCPRQILGVRMAILARDYFDFPLPQKGKRLLTIVETDGCFADGIAVATGCELGHRTLRLMDYGKVAACFIDTVKQKAIRIYPQSTSRQLAQADDSSPNRWQRYMNAYQYLPPESLFRVAEIQLNFSLENLISHPRHRVTCAECQEEIINQREVIQEGQVLCIACANGAYYRPCLEVLSRLNA